MKRVHRIAIILNDRSFEYDIYTLVIAFYQGVPTQVYDSREAACEALSKETACEASSKETACETSSKETACEVISKETSLETVSGETTPEEASDKAPLIVEAQFGDNALCLTAGDLHRELAVPDPGDRAAIKNLLKRNLYEMLRLVSGRGLPWGDLTGIRPIKLAMALLDAELQNDSETKTQEGNKTREENKTPEENTDQDEDIIHEENQSQEELPHSALRAAALQMQERYYVSPGKADLAVRIAQRERSILRGIDTQNGYSLYIGIPFCPSICLYCSFSSSPLGIWKERVDEYLDALIKEIRACRGCFPGKILHTIYIGGGTPTTLSPAQMDRLLTEVEENFDLSQVMEFTVEAGRPDSITEDKLHVLRRHPVTRISVNPQTMNQKTLDLIGRRHTVEDTVNAFQMARSLGFDNINMDLIVGLPGEGIDEVETTMRMIEDLDPDDVTVHALALKRAARLALHMDEYEKISFQASDRIMDRCEEGCRRLGMTPYYLYRQKNMAGNFENVGYAKPEKAGLYNILIMEEVECILALGASGSTKIVYNDGRIERIENVKDIKNYLERIDEMIMRKECIM